MDSAGEREPIRRQPTACKICGEEVKVRDYDREHRMRYIRRGNHDLCKRCWQDAVKKVNVPN